MPFVPWRSVADWRCIACGDCCRLYSVVINFHEWLKIVKNYGIEHTVSGVGDLFIKRCGDGSCVFLNSSYGSCRCGLQHMKPKACQLWPFKVLSVPKYGNTGQAAYVFGEREVYVYVDSMCNGMKYGNPTWDFAGQTLREFVELAMGLRAVQLRTTGNMVFPKPGLRLDGLRMPVTSSCI
jgi:Fe-S-cluster containining protein